MQKVYSRINWENDPSTNTAINEDNLNKMDYALDKIDDRVVQLAGYEERAKTSEENAKASEESAELKRQQAENSAVLSKSYAIGGTGTRENEDVENAKFYYEQAKRISQGLSGTLLPCGTIAFEELADVQALPGYMYNISNDFVTDDRFIHSGIFHGAGANIYMTIDGKWDVLAGSNVVSVNGITGVVILKAADIECSDGETVQSKLDKIGIISNLTTPIKDTIVGAINWIVEQLNTLNTNLANTDNTVSELNRNIEDTDWLNNNLVYYRRKNGVVYVRYDYNSTTAITDGQVLGFLPEGFRPAFERIVPNYNANSYLAINTNGECSVNMVGTNTQVKTAHYYAEYPVG